MGNLFQELKRRKVFRVAAVYAVVAWLLIQVADTVMPALQMPDWTVSFVTVLLILGFPVAIILSWAYDITPESLKPDSQDSPSVASTTAPGQALNFTILILVLAFGVLQLSDRFTDERIPGTDSNALAGLNSSGSVLRAVLVLGQPLEPSAGTGLRTLLTISPDGTNVVYARYNQGIQNRDIVTLKNMSTGEERQLSQTNMFTASFSPSGSRIAMPNSSQLQITSVTGGQQTPLAIAGFAPGPKGTWLGEDRFVYTNNVGKLSIVNIDSGLVTELNEIGVDKPGAIQLTPHALPDQNSLLYTLLERTESPGGGSSDIHLFDLQSGEEHELIVNGYMPTYAETGHIVFMRDSDLWAAPFDLSTRTVSGPEVRLVTAIHSLSPIRHAAYALSKTGRLIYLPARENDPGVPEISLKWVNRDGQEQYPIDFDTFATGNPRLSPDGQTLLLSSYVSPNAADIWVYDIQRQTLSRRTFNAEAVSPIWSPDGRSIVYESVLDNAIYRINSDGTGEPELLIEQRNSNERITPDTFLDDHSFIYRSGPYGGRDIRMASLTDDEWLSRDLLAEEFSEIGAELSPDRRWLAYASDETGQYEIYVKPWPEVGNGKWQVSTEGGLDPKWNPVSDELFYMRTSDSTLVSVPFTAEEAFEPGNPRDLLTGYMLAVNGTSSYEISADGEQFLMMERETSATMLETSTGEGALAIIDNWFEELNLLAQQTD